MNHECFVAEGRGAAYSSVTWETLDTVALTAQVMPYQAGGPHGSLPCQLANLPAVSPMPFFKSRSAAAEIQKKTVACILHICIEQKISILEI